MQLIVILEIMHKSNEDKRQEQMRTKQLKKKNQNPEDKTRKQIKDEQKF